ncbi:MAG TPA: SulP family inorganic anion transporter [Blastocatellia bacterium]|nr:SulP family inorganic anion transporter [Blastocatellia bacterium]
MQESREYQRQLAEAGRTVLPGAPPARQHLGADLVAGLTGAVAGLPFNMAAAVMAGLNPVNGLYAGMIGAPVAALTSNSTYMMVSATSAISLATGSALAGLTEEQKLIAVAPLTILIGLIQTAAGLAKLGYLTRYISNAVMTGFMTGVAFLIILSQLGDLTSLSLKASNQALRLFEAAIRYRELNIRALAAGAVTVALVLAFERTRLKKLAMLLALVAVSCAVNLVSVKGIEMVGASISIPRALPKVVMFDLTHLPGLLISALAIGIIGLVQSAGIGHAYPNPDGKYPEASRDFGAQGVANIASGALRGMPIGGSAWATAVNVNAGAVTRWSQVFYGLFFVTAVLVFGGLIERIPIAALAGLLVLVGFRSLNPGRIQTVWQTSYVAAAVMTLTFVATLTLPIEQAVFLGVAFSFLMTVVREAEKVKVVEIVIREGELPEEREAPRELPSDRITILLPYGSLFFAGARTLEDSLPSADNARRAVVILGLRAQSEIGSTFIGVLRRYSATIQKNGGKLMLAGVNKQVMRQLSKTGTLAFLGEENVFPAGNRLLEPAINALRSARAWLAERNARGDGAEKR